MSLIEEAMALHQLGQPNDETQLLNELFQLTVALQLV